MYKGLYLYIRTRLHLKRDGNWFYSVDMTIDYTEFVYESESKMENIQTAAINNN